MYTAASGTRIRRVTSSPTVTAGFRWPPEIPISAVIMTASTSPWATATPKIPKVASG